VKKTAVRLVWLLLPNTEVIDSTPETLDSDRKPWITIPDRANIICHRLNFHHPGRVELLQDFSLTIPGGRVTAKSKVFTSDFRLET
jgi:ABC-type bacteriocin/lantibiotic exporter with double-glycine peptidase domain